MNLFDLTGETLRIKRQLEEAAEGLQDPETMPAAVEALEALLSQEGESFEALYQKADAYCWLIGEIRATAAARAAEAQRIKDLAASDEQKAQLLEDRLLSCLLKVKPEETKFQLGNHVLTSRKSHRVEAQDAEKLPPAYQRLEVKASGDESAVSALKKLALDFVGLSVTVTPNKDAIKKAVKDGKTVEGAEVVECRSWSIK